MLKDQLTGQLASTPSSLLADTISEELQRIRETLEASVHTTGNSVEASLSSLGNILERLVVGESP